MMVKVSELFKPFAEAAVERLRYIHPEIDFSLTEEGVIVESIANSDLETISRDVHFALYREKILTETLSMRREMMKVMSRQ